MNKSITELIIAARNIDNQAETWLNGNGESGYWIPDDLYNQLEQALINLEQPQ